MSKVQVQILEHPTILNGKFAAIVDGLFSAEEMQAVIDRAESIGFSPAGVGSRNTVMKHFRNSWRMEMPDAEFAATVFERIKSHLPNQLQKRVRGDRYNEPTEFELAGSVREELRILKYEAGHFFDAHYDGHWTRPNSDEISLFTLLLYLNDIEPSQAAQPSISFDPIRRQQVENLQDSSFSSTPDDSEAKCADSEAKLNSSRVSSHGGNTILLADGWLDDELPEQELPVQPRVGRVLVLEQGNLLHKGDLVIGTGVKYCLRTDVMYRPVNKHAPSSI